MNLTSTLILLDCSPAHRKWQWTVDNQQISGLLQRILDDDGTSLREIYLALKPIIQQESRQRGPKNFRKLLNSIFEFIIMYSESRIQSYEEPNVILNLTYYFKIFYQFLTTNHIIQTHIIFSVANIHYYLRVHEEKRLHSVADKLFQIEQIYDKPRQVQDQTYQYFKNVHMLLSGVLAYLRGCHKKANTTFGSFFTMMTNQQKKAINCPQSMEIMSVTAYYSCMNLVKMGEHELSCYYMTKTLEFALKTGDKANSLVNKLREMGSREAYGVVKLTRIENKLEVLNRAKSTWHSQEMKTKIYNKKESMDQNVIDEELRTIFTIKDKKATMYKLRKQNMKYLVKQQNKLTLNIERKEEELKMIAELREKLQPAQEIGRVECLIGDLEREKMNIQSHYIQLKQKHLKKLKPVKNLQIYFKGFATLIAFKKIQYVHEFLYGEMFSRAKIFILSLFMKRRMRKVKKCYRMIKMTINGIIHFIEIYEIFNSQTDLLIYKKKELGNYIKVYPLQHGQASKKVIDEKRISREVVQKIMNNPICYEFQFVGGKLMSWDQYLNKKSFLTIHHVKNFIQRLTKRYKNKQKVAISKIVELNLKFKNYVSINNIVFIKVLANISDQQKKTILNNQSMHVNIFTIGGCRYHNQNYNLVINQDLYLKKVTDLQVIALEVLKEGLMAKFGQFAQQISRLQKFIRRCNCRRKVMKLKIKNKISVFVIGFDIVTYCKYSLGKSFIVMENIQTKEREAIETIIDYQSFQHVSQIKDKISKEKTCKEKLKLTCKYIWTKFFISKLKIDYKVTAILSDFQVSFRNRIVFAKIFNWYLYKNKKVQGKIIFSLVVESLLQFPRPYTLRIFTYSKELLVIDIKKRIYNREKLFYEKNIENLNKIINICSRTEMEKIQLMQEQAVRNYNRRNSKRRGMEIPISKLSNASSEVSLCSVDYEQEYAPKQSSKKTSMLAKMRHRRSIDLNVEDVFQKRISRIPSIYCPLKQDSEALID